MPPPTPHQPVRRISSRSAPPTPPLTSRLNVFRDEPSTPSPPRMRHAVGPTRYEKEVASGYAGVQVDESVKLVGPWKLGKVIGQGASGRVKFARHIYTDEVAAVKIVPRALLTSRDATLDPHRPGRVASPRAVLEREIAILKIIDHPNVMNLKETYEVDGTMWVPLEVWYAPAEREADYSYLVLEFVSGGELFDYIVGKREIDPDEASYHFQQIIAALDYCHTFSVCHRDLKPENILLDDKKQIKIADFGMASLGFGSGGNGLLETSCGSPHYAAPEIVAGHAYHGPAADIWSCGVILFAMLMNRLPFDEPEQSVLLYKVRHGDYVLPQDMVEDARDLVARILVVDPAERITMAEIKRHPFFQRDGYVKAGHVQPLPHCPSPDINQLAHPISPRERIDAEAFKALLAVSPGVAKSDMIMRLTNETPNWNKVIYHLLLDHKQKRVRAEEAADRAEHLQHLTSRPKTTTPTPYDQDESTRVIRNGPQRRPSSRASTQSERYSGQHGRRSPTRSHRRRPSSRASIDSHRRRSSADKRSVPDHIAPIPMRASRPLPTPGSPPKKQHGDHGGTRKNSNEGEWMAPRMGRARRATVQSYRDAQVQRGELSPLHKYLAHSRQAPPPPPASVAYNTPPAMHVTYHPEQTGYISSTLSNGTPPRLPTPTIEPAETLYEIFEHDMESPPSALQETQYRSIDSAAHASAPPDRLPLSALEPSEALYDLRGDEERLPTRTPLDSRYRTIKPPSPSSLPPPRIASNGFSALLLKDALSSELLSLPANNHGIRQSRQVSPMSSSDGLPRTPDTADLPLPADGLPGSRNTMANLKQLTLSADPEVRKYLQVVAKQVEEYKLHGKPLSLPIGGDTADFGVQARRLSAMTVDSGSFVLVDKAQTYSSLPTPSTGTIGRFASFANSIRRGRRASETASPRPSQLQSRSQSTNRGQAVGTASSAGSKRNVMRSKTEDGTPARASSLSPGRKSSWLSGIFNRAPLQHRTQYFTLYSSASFDNTLTECLRVLNAAGISLEYHGKVITERWTGRAFLAMTRDHSLKFRLTVSMLNTQAQQMDASMETSQEEARQTQIELATDVSQSQQVKAIRVALCSDPGLHPLQVGEERCVAT